MRNRHRNPRAVQPTHDYDIIEGPVADDKISTEINNYLAGKITREDFLTMLIHGEESHQICFCSGRSLQMLDNVDKPQIDINFSIENISESIVEQLMLDLQIDEIKAADVFYSSATFTQLANPDTKFYEKDWQEIFQMLMQE